MKRFTILLAVLLVAASASAQVRITKEEHPVTKVADLTLVAFLMQRDSTYFITFLTDNRFDDPILISLGEGVEESLASLDALDEMMAGIARDETYHIEDMYGEDFLVSKIKLTKYASLSSKKRAGKGTLHPQTIERARKALLGEK